MRSRNAWLTNVAEDYAHIFVRKESTVSTVSERGRGENDESDSLRHLWLKAVSRVFRYSSPVAY